MDWIISNKEWLFSGLGLALIPFIFKLTHRNSQEKTTENSIKNNITINNDHQLPSIQDGDEKCLQHYKNNTKILFIDDDTSFKVAKILKKSGWVHTKLVKECETLDDAEITSSDILFIDVQGVGIELGFNDEGLGLALAIKEKYPSKKVVIYSAEKEGERFHQALRKADSFLEKNADPYEFQKIVEEFTIGATE